MRNRMSKHDARLGAAPAHRCMQARVVFRYGRPFAGAYRVVGTRAHHLWQRGGATDARY